MTIATMSAVTTVVLLVQLVSQTHFVQNPLTQMMFHATNRPANVANN